MSVARYFNKRLRPLILAGEEPDWLKRHPRRGYIVQAVISCPPWCGRVGLMALHKEAARLTKETGIEYVMSHIIPLNHPYVCGLTVPWNIELLPRKVNARRGNRWHPDQMEMQL